MYISNTQKLLSVNGDERERLLNACVQAQRAVEFDAANSEKKSGKTSPERQKHNNDIACLAAKKYLEEKDPKANIYYFGPSKTGEINQIAHELAGILKRISDGESKKYSAPCYVIQGYVNTTITVGEGGIRSHGGKSLHQAMIMAKELKEYTNVTGICVKTNWDGNTCSIGAIFDYHTNMLLSKSASIDESIRENESFSIMKSIRATIDTQKERGIDRTDIANKARLMIVSVRKR